ncbi:DEAD/DEAH box helicase [Virgibacillus sp. W0181]|uniref:DEAD/DEAH box helicase n=1 Tax=Virgibacillus sp. W0181 TaxID=3391581 RepID=UPI003F4893E2
MELINVKKDHTFIKELELNLKNEGPFSSWQLFQLAYEAEANSISPDFNGLRALKHLPHVQFLDHQIKSAETVIEDMNGRAILADEVGLGKTIEAGLIIKEYMIRGLVKNILLLVPASLVNQWVRELNEKFYIPAVAYRKNYAWNQHNVFVTSMDTAKRSPHKEDIQKLDYDLLLIDEAHKLKNHKTKNYQFVQSINKKYCLLLTATPVQNQLIEIFNLISILKPGHLGSYSSFQEKFGKNRSQIKKDAFLKKLVQKVMVRNTRENTTLNNVKRDIQTIWIDFSPEELEVYTDIESNAELFTAFSRIMYLRELCSSREACYLSLTKLANEGNEATVRPIINKIEQLPHHQKAKKLIELLKQIGDEKVIIFTEYRASQYYLQWYLQQHGITAVPFRGGFKRGKKDWMQQLFKNHVQVMIATEAGGEGINLQFCNHLINYDLPWNPMRLEQRIGRIHRFGQSNEVVHIYNLSINGTIEAHIMKLLYEKIELFEKVIGQLDQILDELHIHDLESEIETIFSESASQGEMKIKMDNLTSIIEQTNNDMNNRESEYGTY